VAAPVLLGGVIAAASLFTPGRAAAQARPPAPAREEVRERIVLRGDGPAMTLWRSDRDRDRDRAVLGVTLAPGSRGDTAGVRLEAVDADSPAAKAGLKAGDVLTAINGVSLRVAPEDADDPALGGLAQRRLQRTLAKAKPGDAVTLQVRTGSSARSVTVTTVSAADLAAADRMEERVIVRPMETDRRPGASRGMVGLSIGVAGNLRDTLGLFVSGVLTGGPADKAGIVEGERVAAVNGMDVRIPREDIEDPQATSRRLDHFSREVQRAEPGKSLALKVYGNGRFRDVMVAVEQAATRAPSMPQVIRLKRDGEVGRLQLDNREIVMDYGDLERRMERWGEEFGRSMERSLRGLELDLRELPQPPGVVRVMPRLTRTLIL
jgi:C-terminal processing protease CtpA/Prc